MTLAGDVSRRRVLVVDDNADMRGYVASLLEGTYAVSTAVDGQDALEQVLVQVPDLVLTAVSMPRLDGLALLSVLRADPLTAGVPVIVLTTRQSEQALVAGREAAADEYLAKPFSATELTARVRSQLDLQQVRRLNARLERSQLLLDRAERLAGVGSWELEPLTGVFEASAEFCRQMQVTSAELTVDGILSRLQERVHPEDRHLSPAAFARAVAEGTPFAYEVRMQRPDGSERVFRTVGEAVRDESGAVVRLHGSNQDITAQRRVDAALLGAAADREALVHEHRIADALQASLLPTKEPVADHLEIAAFYRAGVEGTQVGGDWYDVIELGAGRTALVLGDVMGRGVRAAAVMGQLRTAVRAYARLDLPPGDVLEHLDGIVRELGDDQIVTAVYAVYDPTDRTLTWANAGHLPLLVRLPGQPTRRLMSSNSPPLGAGLTGIEETALALPTGALVAMFTDGLVERRGGDLDVGIDALARELDAASGPLRELPTALTAALLPEGLDDDVAVLLVQVARGAGDEHAIRMPLTADVTTVSAVRHAVTATLRSWQVLPHLVEDIELLVSELVTNAVLYGLAPMELRLRTGAAQLVLEVADSAVYLPRRIRATANDEHGRGLQLAALLADRWGTRPTGTGKVVWCVFSLT